jgi:hypothetical protein
VHDVFVRFFPCRVYIDSSRRDTLRYEWSLVRCCYLVVFFGWIAQMMVMVMLS